MSAEAVHAGQAVYSGLVLRLLYDGVVLGVSNPLIWKCPTARLLAHYDANVSANHLDVGVGTGWFLDHCRFPSPQSSFKGPRLALMDLNPNCLEHAAGRVARHAPETHRRNVLEPIPFDGPRFDSVGLCYLLHCLPGAMAEKAVVFDHLRPLMNDGAVLFGATLVQGSAPRSAMARRLMAAYNRKGIFCNQDDTVEALDAGLAARFAAHAVELVGCAALFRATV
ncbi:class I SAM-dependent methyltransferase [Azospirillum sp.]|uniref:class I SAM-dependent methyltransferase n=1 Tax=Azospirillum sp. TaxID=34012 RepID=UPI003D751A07